MHVAFDKENAHPHWCKWQAQAKAMPQLNGAAVKELRGTFKMLLQTTLQTHFALGHLFHSINTTFGRERGNHVKNISPRKRSSNRHITLRH